MPDAAPDPASTPRGRLRAILEGLESYVESERENGARALPATPALVSALGEPLPPPARRPAAAPPEGGAPATPPPAPVPPPADPAAAQAALAAIAERVRACTACPLHKTRTKAVPGQGHPAPEILFVGEGPGAEEDQQGLAFVGAAGQLLTRMIAAMGFTRDQVFIANIVKCRPPGNRVPEPAEAAACIHFLEDQIAALRPRVIVTLGATALKYLMGMDRAPITRMRGSWLSRQGIDVMPTFHPSFLLRDPTQKPRAWDDLKAVLARLGRPVPEPPRKG